MTETAAHLTDFVNVGNPYSVIAEIRGVVRMIYPDFDFRPVRGTFDDVVRLFAGKFPGYRRCNTEYHDLKHTTDVTLALMGLIHGAILKGKDLSKRDITIALVTSLLHDTGYIQTVDDTQGTGAKYTQVHIDRSIEFMGKYFDMIGFAIEDFKDGSDIVNCTGLNADIRRIRFRSKSTELLGKMLGTADLLGQMGDRNYLEKLLFLFYEFREAGISDYTSELDLLRKTTRFYDMTKKRLAVELGHVERYMIYHCRTRWGVDRDLYKATIDANMEYLQFVLKNHAKQYRQYLRRGGYVRKLESMGRRVDAAMFSEEGSVSGSVTP
jgi:ribosomal protein L17